MSEGLLVCGVTGVGKSSMVGEIGRVVSGADRPIAVVDTDQLAQFGPPPPKDPVTGRRAFYDELKCRNLSSVWTNFRAAGAKHIVVAAGIESVELRTAYSKRWMGVTSRWSGWSRRRRWSSNGCTVGTTARRWNDTCAR